MINMAIGASIASVLMVPGAFIVRWWPFWFLAAFTVTAAVVGWIGWLSGA